MSGAADGLEARIATLLEAYDRERGADAEFLGLQFDLGLAWVQHPTGEGGLGVNRTLQRLVDRELARAGVHSDEWRAGIGLALAAPTIAAFGTAEQKQRHLRPIFTGAEVWCQLFSEPGAGSDLAGLATRAVRRGDEWVVNGQKVWTSLGHAARWGILCARTDPDLPKHEGLTYFIADMRAAGVEARPLRQLTGEAEFDEVFFNDVVIADEQRLGAVGQGWTVTLTTLANERAAFGSEVPARGGGMIAHALELWNERGDRLPHCRDRVLELAVRAEALRLTAVEAHASEEADTPSSAWSFLKLAQSELDKEILDCTITLLGAEGLTYDGYELTVPDAMGAVPKRSDIRRAFLYARAMTIAGGTSEIQRTIIADRVLRLPREPQSIRDIPWRDIPRG